MYCTLYNGVSFLAEAREIERNWGTTSEYTISHYRKHNGSQLVLLHGFSFATGTWKWNFATQQNQIQNANAHMFFFVLIPERWWYFGVCLTPCVKCCVYRLNQCFLNTNTLRELPVCMYEIVKKMRLIRNAVKIQRKLRFVCTCSCKLQLLLCMLQIGLKHFQLATLLSHIRVFNPSASNVMMFCFSTTSRRLGKWLFDENWNP